MKVEDPSALLVQWFHHKTHVLPKGDESSWQNYTNYAARSATTKRDLIATEKIKPGIRSTSARSVGINGHRILQRDSRGVLGRRGILCVLFAERQCMCITIGRITSTPLAQTRSAATPFLYQSLLLSQLRPCPSSLERQILSGCAIRSM